MFKKSKSLLKNLVNYLKDWFSTENENGQSSRRVYVKAGALALVLIGIVGIGKLVINGDTLNKRNVELYIEDYESTDAENLDDLADQIALFATDSINRGIDEADALEETETSSSSESTNTTTSTTESTTTTTTTTETTTLATTTTAPTTSAPKSITVQKGEGWWHLGERAGVDFRYLAVFNGKLWTDPVHSGQTYKIPSAEELSKIKLPQVTTTSTTKSFTNTSVKQSQSTVTPTQASSEGVSSPLVYTLNQFLVLGRLNWQGKQFTYYSQRVLPGYGLRIPGRHVSAAGYVVDGNGYIVLASDSYPKGTVVSTPFGAPGKVYDAFGTGEGAYRFDVYIR